MRTFDAHNHCAACLRGHWSNAIHGYKADATRPGKPVEANVTIALDEFEAPFIYLCGVADLETWTQRQKANLHLPMRAKPGAPEQRFTAYNGVTVVLRNVEVLPIPAVPRGFRGQSWEKTTCRNWLFGIAHMEPAGLIWQPASAARGAACAA